MRAVPSGGAVSALLVLCACSAGTSGTAASGAPSPGSGVTAGSAVSQASTPPPVPPVTTGVLTGVTRMWGGPMTPSGKQALNGDAAPGNDVVVLSGADHVATVTSGPGGVYRVDLRPGTYTLQCGRSPVVVIHVGEATHADCDVVVP